MLKVFLKIALEPYGVGFRLNFLLLDYRLLIIHNVHEDGFGSNF